MSLFPYRYRGDQKRIVDSILTSVDLGVPMVMESGTGTGKTISSLSGALEVTLGTDKKVIYLTRTKSQQHQIIKECAAITERKVACLGMHGRSAGTCPMMRDDPDKMSGSPEELSKLCAQLKKKDADGRCKCGFFANLDSLDPIELADTVREEHLMPEEFSELCASLGVCTYEASKMLLPYMDVIAVPYPFIFYSMILERFIQWVGVPLQRMVLIADEAHNLPAYLRDVMSLEYSLRSLELTEKEAKEQDNPELPTGLRVLDITAVFRQILDNALKEYLNEDDGILPYNYLMTSMMEILGMPTVILATIFGAIVDQGEALAQKKMGKGKLPRSHMRSFGNFLLAWMECDEYNYVQLVNGGDNPGFEAYCLDPMEPAQPMRGAWSSISMSGTLVPVKPFCDELGLEDCTREVFPTPFDKENLKVLYVNDVSTSYDDLSASDECYDRLFAYIVRIAGSTTRNTAIFFPSYALMDRFIADGLDEALGRPIYHEQRGMPQNELMDVVMDFKASKGSILFCITGGRISEGLDFPDDTLELAIIVGIPYPKPTSKQDALVRYYQHRFGKGWENAVRIPTERKMRQAIGRLIRSETDRGVAVILDRRVVTMDSIDAILTNDPVSDIKVFFNDPL